MANNSNNKKNYCKPTPKHCNHENNLPSEFYQVERTITDINNHLVRQVILLMYMMVLGKQWMVIIVQIMYISTMTLLIL